MLVLSGMQCSCVCLKRNRVQCSYRKTRVQCSCCCQECNVPACVCKWIECTGSYRRVECNALLPLAGRYSFVFLFHVILVCLRQRQWIFTARAVRALQFEHFFCYTHAGVSSPPPQATGGSHSDRLCIGGTNNNTLRKVLLYGSHTMMNYVYNFDGWHQLQRHTMMSYSGDLYGWHMWMGDRD